MSAAPRIPAGAELPPLVIANPAARSGRTHLEIEATALRERIGPVDLALTRHAGHATTLARGAVAEGRRLVISVGGDGVMSEVVDGLLTPKGPAPRSSEPGAPASFQAQALSTPALGIVAAGTGGDFRRSLGLGPGRDAYVGAIAAGRERLVDVARACFVGHDGCGVRRHVVNVLSAGIGGLVDRYTAAMPAAVPGRLAYGGAALAAVVACRRRRLLCRATLADGRSVERRLWSHAVVVANGHTFGGGMRVAPDARVDDGLLDVVVLEPPTRLTLLHYFLSIYRGEHLTKPGVSTFRCTRVELLPWDEERPAGAPRRDLFPLDVDGDALGDIPLSVEVLPARLRVLA